MRHSSGIRGLAALLAINILATIGVAADNAGTADAWNIESPPGPRFQQKIETTEGTWMNLDVSPDGATVVFDLLGDLYLMPIAGADGSDNNLPRKLTSGVAWDMQPRFSPDGQWIAFTSDRAGHSNHAGDNIWIIKVDGSETRQITNETYRLVSGAAWSPDGEYLIARKHFTSRRSLGAGEIWMYHRASAQMKAMSGVQLTTRPNDQKDVNEPVFSPDGRYVYYSQDTTPGDAFEYDKDSNKQIYVIKRLDLHRGETESFVTGPGGACRPTPSPDGTQLAFVRRVEGRTGLHVMDLRSGAIRLINDQLERDMQEAWAIHGVYPTFAWTPDGQQIVIWAQGKIRRIDVANGTAEVIPFAIRDERQMTRRLRFPIEVAPEEFAPRMLRWVSVSPNGNQVAYQTLGHIYLQDLPDGTPRRLTTQSDHFEFYPSYSRDGRYLVYTTWHDKQLGSVRVASTDTSGPLETWQVTTEPGHYVEPVFSPDGQSIVFVKTQGGYLTSPQWSREPGLYLAPTRGGTAVRLRPSGQSPQFADTSDRVYFVTREASKDADNLTLASVDLTGNDHREHYRSTWATDMKLSQDGSWIAFVERFHVHVAPFIRTGRLLEIGPNSSALPTVKVSREAGTNVHFAGDSGQLHWSLGRTLYSLPLQDAFAYLRDPAAVSSRQLVNARKDGAAKVEDSVEEGSQKIAEDPAQPSSATAASQTIGPQVKHARPDTTIALVGGRLVTMTDRGIINDGVIVIQGNRIQAVGARGEVEIPDGADIVPTPGLVILPGYIDVHAHGPQAAAGLTPQANWIDYARLAFGVTTIHDPSNDTEEIFSASEMTKAGVITAPRTFSTGTILYGATGSYHAEVASLDDARFHLRRMKAVGAFSVKSYNQPRRDQRQQVVAAARELEMMVVPEGGSTFMHNMTMIVDGHTGIEHTLPVQNAYDDVMDLWRGTEVGYTPTFNVAYGGISGERYWYAIDDLYTHPRLRHFLPPHVLQPRARRREKAPLEEYNHMKVAGIARQVVEQGGLAQAGGHGQLAGICTHWEMWTMVQGGMKPIDALRCGTLYGARYLGLDGDLGSLEAGKLADLVVIQRGFDPTREIRDSERIELVIANGRVFQADTMRELLGDKVAAPDFYFHHAGHALGTLPPNVRGCGCARPGGMTGWTQQLRQ